MPLKDALLAEFDHEMGTTRRLLERVPEADFGWKPHEKSYSLGQLAGHIAHLPRWLGDVSATETYDADKAAEQARPTVPASGRHLLTAFDESVAQARKCIDGLTDATMLARWTLKNGDVQLFSMPRASVLRMFIMNHLIHHRGQLSVYLRMRNVPVPSMYGPTADEQ